jgi:hypothetical protein
MAGYCLDSPQTATRIEVACNRIPRDPNSFTLQAAAAAAAAAATTTTTTKLQMGCHPVAVVIMHVVITS